MPVNLSRARAWLNSTKLQVSSAKDFNQAALYQTIKSLIDQIDVLQKEITAADSETTTIGGTGTTDIVAKFIAPGIIGDSSIFDDGSNVGIGTITPGAELEINGQIKITGGIPGVSKVLTSDVDGLATWETPSSGNSDVNRVVATGITRTILDKYSVVAVDYFAVEGTGILAIEGDGALAIR